MATSIHNKYVSIPDWFSSSSSTPITSAEKPANITNVYYGGGGGGSTTEIPIDNKTIVWQDQVITVPIDNNKIIINTEGKITTSDATGVWELRQLTDGTNYIYTTYPVVTQLGITMYAGTDGLDLGSIYDGLPIDNATIYWDLDENGNKILKAVGSSGGVADSVAWTNVTEKPDWLLDSKIQYTEIEGTPDLSGFITKDYVDGKFVTFDLNETIYGIKTFTNGIKIGTSLINQSQEDIIYIDANLVVRGGITMYATGTVDIPSILDSLPVAGTDSKGIASFDSSYFSVTNGKVTLLADNVGLNESELAEYLNTNNYAKKSDIPSLNDYAKQSWVESKGYALNSDLMQLTTKVDDFLEGSDTDTIINKWKELEVFLNGLSESDSLATILSSKVDKDYVDGNFVTLGGIPQTITGEKNFTGGLKVNGSPIVYDATKKYWKLEGDLLVTGGITMYGNEGTYTPSTIMDAVAVDGTTISKEGGVLRVIGGTGGGSIEGLANVAYSGKYDDLIGKPTLLSSFTDDIVSGKYLPLSGGTITNNSAVPLTINANNDGQVGLFLQSKGNNKTYVGWDSSRGTCLYEFASDSSLNILNGVPRFNANTLWHSGNDGSGSTLDADLLDGKHLSDILASNVASATKLQTARTIWGQSFDGTGNVSGSLSDVTGITFKNDYYGLIIDEFGNFSFKKPSSTAAADWSFKDSSGNKLMIINNSGNVGIGTTSPSSKLEVSGLIKANYYDVNTTRQTTLTNSYTLGCGMYGSSIQHSVSNGYTLPALMWSAKSPNGNSSQFSIMSYHPSGATGYLIIGVAKNGTRGAFIEVQGDGVIQAGGDFLASGGITMYSDQRKKTILNNVELSLKQIANAPLVEHYYNSDEKKTTHVGSIAQYWASMNDWFCKEDAEGFLTMEIQNAALASAISIARELDRYETKTYKTIKQLRKRICQLEEEIQRLKSV